LYNNLKKRGYIHLETNTEDVKGPPTLSNEIEVASTELKSGKAEGKIGYQQNC